MSDVDHDDLIDWIIDRLAGYLQIPAAEIGAEVAFEDLGMSSAKAVEFSGDLERHLGIALSPTLLYDHPTVESLAEHLSTASSTP